MDLKESLIKLSGFWFCKRKNIPVGCDYFNDLKYKIRLPIHTVFDVGANVGQTANLVSHYFKESTIYSFEPVAATYQHLLENTKKLARVKCFQLALGDKVDSIELDLFDDQDSCLNSCKKTAMNRNAKQKETIHVVPGDVFCQEHNVSEIDLLKIDTEGFELEVLRGFEQMLSESRIKAIYCEVGFSLDDNRHTFINDLINVAINKRFRFYGLYEVDNIHVEHGGNFGNLLFINNGLNNSTTLFHS